MFEISHLCRRRDAIYPATVVGKPRQEDFYIGDLLQELLSPLFPLVMPGVRDLWSYGETGYHSLAAAVVRERYRREAMTSAFRILGEGQLALTKFLLVLDRPVDLRDFRATLVHLLERTQPESDLFVVSNLSMDTLDYTGPRVNEGSKGVWLGLGDPVRELPREFRPRIEPPPEVTSVAVFCPGCLVVGGPPASTRPGFAAQIAAHPAFAEWPLLVISDEPQRAARSPMNFLWTTFTRFEPAADIHAAKQTVVRNHVALSPPSPSTRASSRDSRPSSSAMRQRRPKSPRAGRNTFRTVASRWETRGAPTWSESQVAIARRRHASGALELACAVTLVEVSRCQRKLRDRLAAGRQLAQQELDAQAAHVVADRLAGGFAEGSRQAARVDVHRQRELIEPQRQVELGAQPVDEPVHPQRPAALRRGAARRRGQELRGEPFDHQQRAWPQGAELVQQPGGGGA